MVVICFIAALDVLYDANILYIFVAVSTLYCFTVTIRLIEFMIFIYRETIVQMK